MKARIGPGACREEEQVPRGSDCLCAQAGGAGYQHRGGGLAHGKPHRHQPGSGRIAMALWRRRPKAAVTVHSDQGCQFTGHKWQTFLLEHDLVSSKSRRGSCHDSAVAESFFQLLKHERVRRQITPRAATPVPTFSTTSRCSTTPSGVTNRRRYFADRVRTTPFPTAHRCLGNPGDS